MNPAKKFFRKYICSAIGILLLFFAVNLLLVIGFLIASNSGGRPGERFQISRFSGHITSQNGAVRADEEALSMLRSESAWAMLLNEEGDVIWEEGLPEELPRSYLASDIASFSKWYLEDYPVTVWTREDGLLVVGFPKGSVYKYNLSNKIEDFYAMVMGAAAIFAMNLVLLLYLFLRNTRRIERAMEPILSGIQRLSQGKEVRLKETGELAQINADLNQAAEYLMKKEDARAEWIRGISHDIRTPLSVIMGYAGGLEEDARVSEEVRGQAAIICRQSERIKSLVDDLNLTAKLEYSCQPLRRHLVRAAEVARKAVSEVLNAGLGGRYELEFQQIWQGESLWIEGDEALFARMLCNLIRNSVVHNPGGCRIMVTVDADDAECCFRVTDDGLGMSGDLLEALHRKEAGWSTQEDGMEHGLGLKIVCRIVEAYGGRILFENTAPHGLDVSIFFERRPSGVHV